MVTTILPMELSGLPKNQYVTEEEYNGTAFDERYSFPVSFVRMFECPPAGVHG
jgi:hypothetical protein